MTTQKLSKKSISLTAQIVHKRLEEAPRSIRELASSRAAFYIKSGMCQIETIHKCVEYGQKLLKEKNEMNNNIVDITDSLPVKQKELRILIAKESLLWMAI